MGTRGPVPKRSDQRVRRNKTDTDNVTVTEMTGVSVAPELGLDDPDPVIAELWESLINSAQARYYEASDWAYARFNLHFADKLIKSSKPSSQMLAAVNAALGELLVSEGARRRVRMEIERDQDPQTSASVSAIADYKQMFSRSS